MSERMQNWDALAETNELLKTIGSPGRAAPAIKFHLLNFCRSSPTRSHEEIEAEINKMQELADKERRYEGNKKIPTIGTELEIPKGWMKESASKELSALGIHNEPEPSHDHLWEINQYWSYSYAVQARAIEELRKVGIVKNSPDDSLSLHVNFGIPDYTGGSVGINNNSHTLEFVNASAVAYASINRLSERKSTSVYGTKEDTESNDRTGYYRFEIRPHEFKDKQTYKMLFELQMLTAGFFAFAKAKFAPNSADDIDKNLADTWLEFIEKCNAVFDRFGIKRDNYADTDYAEHIEVMRRKPEFAQEVKALFSSYAARLRDEIFMDEAVSDWDDLHDIIKTSDLPSV